ncbi:hypothetical protein DSM112329_04673 [Paraconexibacter sp. AEG42_29]|uniref:ABC-2 type transporter transmembrane domain-containing protein n=1 Tax=Paraconexibacter sp. AEG42_29 TaxID=2997339 RepID=A0AAU7B1I1_9ACTN
MNARSQVVLVAQREVRERLRNKAFRITTLIFCLAAVGAGLAAGLIGSGGADEVTVGTSGPDAARVVDGMQAAGKSYDLKPEQKAFGSAASARAAVDEGDVDLAIVDGPRLLVGVDADARSIALAQAAWRADAQRQAVERGGLRGAEARAVLSPAPLPTTELGDADADAKQGVAYIGALLLYLVIFTYGLTVSSGVVEEKSSRVVEILQAAVPPRRLLLGKVLGLGLVGLLQTAAFLVLGAIAATASGAFDASGIAAGAAAITGLYFMLGYLLYACAYAMAGALCARQEDLQSVTSPLTILLVGGYLLSTGAISSPDGTIATAMSLFPPWAPIVMPGRVIQGAVAWWEVALSVALMLAMTLVVLRLADRIYRGASLQVRGRTSLKAALGGAGR